MEKFKSIRFKELKEESLPSNRYLLHAYFQDNYGNLYRWTPAWKEVESIFLKAVRVEEWNYPEGVWAKELREASERMPSLKGFGVPIKLQLGWLKDKGACYEVSIHASFLEQESEKEWKGEIIGSYEQEFSIGKCKVNFPTLKWAVLDRLNRVLADKISAIDIKDHCVCWSDRTVSFDIQLKKELEDEYPKIIRHVAEVVRSYIRKVVSDYDHLREELD